MADDDTDNIPDDETEEVTDDETEEVTDDETEEVTEDETEEIAEDEPEVKAKPKAKPKTKPKTKDRSNDNTVYIGKKPTMNYVLAVTMQVNSGSNKVVIKARGKSISKAVDVAEIVRNRFVQDLKIDDIQISTEVLENEEGRSSNVSSIEIFMKK